MLSKERNVPDPTTTDGHRNASGFADFAELVIETIPDTCDNKIKYKLKHLIIDRASWQSERDKRHDYVHKSLASC